MGIGTAYGSWSPGDLPERPSVIYACGPESSLKSEMLDQLKQTFPDEDRETISLYADEATPSDVMNELDSQGLFNETTWVLLKQLELKDGGQPQLARYFDSLVEYLEDPNPGSLLVLFDEAHPYKSGRKTGSLARAVEDAGGEVVVFWEPFDREVYQRIRSIFEEHDLEWASGTIEAIAERSEGKIARIQQETEKLVDFFEPGDRIDREDVVRIVSDEEAADSYKALKKAMVSGSLSSCVQKLDEFYRQSSSGGEVAVGHTVLNYFKDVRDIRRMTGDGTSLEDAMKKKGIPTSQGIKEDYQSAISRIGQFPRDFFRRGYRLLKDVKYRPTPMNRRSLEQFMFRTIPDLIR